MKIEKRLLNLCLTVVLLVLFLPAFAGTQNDTLNYRVIYSMALKGEIRQVLAMFDTLVLQRKEDIQFRNEFRQRFAFAEDRLPLPAGTPAPMRPLMNIFQNYWRQSLMNKARNYDSVFKSTLSQFLQKANNKKKYYDSTITIETLPEAYKAYMIANGFQSTEFGKTGFLYDLIAWDTMNTLRYNVSLTHDTLEVDVNFIDDFFSLGWLSYARLGRTSPGGWATKTQLYCVTRGYDTSAEKFQLSFLKHEGQHFADYQKFGDLPPADLEYRAKLQELHYARTDLLLLINTFANGALYDSTNSHPFANYCVIRDLSHLLFGKDFVKEQAQWSTIDADRIRQAAYDLFVRHTNYLKKGDRLK